MSESDDRFQSTEEKEQHASGDKDVEGHQQVQRAADDDTDEPDVEGHQISPQTSPQTDG
jgi:hypothetical protein